MHHQKAVSVFLMTLNISLLCGCFAPHTGYFGMVSYHESDKPDTMLYEDFLYSHRSPMVRYPAKTGYDAGTLAALPIGWTSYGLGCVMLEGGEDRMYYLDLPVAVTGSLMGSVVGYPSWMLFGWWWSDHGIKKGDLPRKAEAASEAPHYGSSPKRSPMRLDAPEVLEVPRVPSR